MTNMFKNQVVLVTGGTKGIGRAIACYFAERGAVVNALYSFDHEAANQLKKDMETKGYQSDVYQCDVTNLDRVKNTVEKIIEKNGRIDILVNNAAVVKDQYCMMMKPGNWHRVIDVGLNGVFYLCKSVLPFMLKNQYGKIINISSTSGLMGKPGQTNYAATKAGLIGFSKSLARELAPYNIAVNVVAPGFIQTEMVDKINPGLKEEYISNIPIKRMGNPDEVANVVGFLASKEADYIIGTTIVVDGGLTC